MAAVEALVRWPHARHGMLSPDQFIPLAEQTGLIRPLSRWVLGAALRQQHAWRRLGLDVPVSMNLSMLDLHDLSLPEPVAALFEELGVARGALRVELLRALGCDKARGDLISRPRAASDPTPWLLRHGDDTTAAVA